MMFPMLLPVPRTNISLGTGAECFLAHAGSASMASGLSAGAVPEKVMVPVTDAPATTARTPTPGPTDTATSPAAKHHLFAVQPMLSSLVICTPRPRRHY